MKNWRVTLYRGATRMGTRYVRAETREDAIADGEWYWFGDGQVRPKNAKITCSPL